MAVVEIIFMSFVNDCVLEHCVLEHGEEKKKKVYTLYLAHSEFRKQKYLECTFVHEKSATKIHTRKRYVFLK